MVAACAAQAAQGKGTGCQLSETQAGWVRTQLRARYSDCCLAAQLVQLAKWWAQHEYAALVRKGVCSLCAALAAEEVWGLLSLLVRWLSQSFACTCFGVSARLVYWC